MGGRILIVDDEPDMMLLLKRIISEESDHKVVTEHDPQKALALFSREPFDMVISDLKMPKLDGVRLLGALKEIRADVSVVIITAYATIETAIEATRKGAYDYITKPFRRERILMTVDKAMKWQAIIRENQALREALAEKKGFAALVGSSPAMQSVFERIRQVAPTMGTVLITGPSGTGKELVAQAIHQHSARGARKMVTINCTAIPENVLESELFGHVRGAFTGAWKDKKGLVEAAHESTLFLDEIGDLSPMLQTKLLRLVQEGEYKPVGSVTTRIADLRFIAATNHDLKADIEAKRFREDLYYRLNVIRFDLPPLKEHREDIPLLCHHFLEKYARLNQKEIRNLSPSVIQTLMAFDFPGNVRELENIIERGVIFCRGDTLRTRDLFLDGPDKPGFVELNPEITQLPFKEAKERVVDIFHRQYVEVLLQENNGNVSRAAEKAGIQRQYFHRLMKEAGIEANGFKEMSPTPES
jgi:DNA-binding NtrC family response regulator